MEDEMPKDDSSISFGVGLLLGVVGGVIAAVLYTPKSGEETRKEVENVIVDLAQKYTPEIKEAKKQALTSIDVMRYRLEQQYNKINETIKAKQIAKAKEKETTDYDVN
ncbi:MAG: YtxH domain-containing protein [Candidatus Gastranaerophilales bacterium]|nr:YtxH domain-containing protein [Candidatus Gastranaerophilales bacterium]